MTCAGASEANLQEVQTDPSHGWPRYSKESQGDTEESTEVRGLREYCSTEVLKRSEEYFDFRGKDNSIRMILVPLCQGTQKTIATLDALSLVGQG